jgi:hypothetical protein
VKTGNERILHGGGWFEREAIGKPRARFFGFLSLAWLFVCVAALIPIWPLWHKLPPLGFTFGWLCVLLLVPEPVLVALALLFWAFEKPRKFIVRR